MLLKSPEQYYTALTKFAQATKHGIVTSFGVFAGVTFDGDIANKYPSADRIFLDAVKDHPDISVIAGVHSYYSPKTTGCRDCVHAYTRRTLRIEKHREFFPNVNWRMLHSLHSKVCVFWDEDKIFAVIGSRNFTGSSNIEVAVAMVNNKDALEAKEYALGLLKDSQEVSLDSIMTYLVDQTGSDHCLKVICGDA